MRIKKAVKVLLSCILAGALFTGCGGGDTPAKTDSGDKPAASSEEIKLGMISHLNATEKRMEEILKIMQEDSGINILT